MKTNLERIAQTNLQLFHQLQDAGYDEADLISIYKAYQLASRVFTGFFRGSGKTFLAHLVGTASILAFLNAPIEIVAGGLLHAVYELGDFGDGGRGISPKKRDKVRQVMGPKVEDYVAGYTALQWNKDNIITLHRNLEKLEQIQKEILLMRLANALEDHFDRNVLYCAKGERRLDHLNVCGHLMVEMATELGYPQLARELDSVFKQTLSGQILPALQNNTSYSYVITTSSPLKRFIGQWRYRIVQRFKMIVDHNNKKSQQLPNF